MTFLCLNCDRDKIEYSIKSDHLPDLGNKIKIYTINIIEFDKVDEILNNYISIYNKDYDIYFINCKFKIEFDISFTTNIETNYIHNKESEKINIILKYFINCHKSTGYKFHKINEMTIFISNNRCYMTYDNYMNLPMSMLERQINFNIGKNPKLRNSFDRNKNHPLVRKYSHIPFNK